MFIHRLTALATPLPEGPFALLAQAETVFQKGMEAADKFGNGSDGMKFAMTLIALVVGLGILSWLYLSGVKETIKEQRGRIAELEKEIREIHKGHEAQYAELREECDRRLAGYWGTFEMAIRELAKNNQWLQGQGFVPRQHETPAIQMPPPSQQSQSPQRPSFFPQSRRIPRRAGEQNQDDYEQQ